MPILVLATTNPGKVTEIRTILTSYLDLDQVAVRTPQEMGLRDFVVEEDGETFSENALIKARAVAAATGCIALADDSGLCVDALDGAPGIHSARWTGAGATDADRAAALLERLADVPDDRRLARFLCAAAAVTPDGAEVVAEGVCEGVIARVPSGSGGFGYDPVFRLPAFAITMAELTPEQKNAVSHRAQALSRLAPALGQMLRGKPDKV